jgi:hypothetical protein
MEVRAVPGRTAALHLTAQQVATTADSHENAKPTR